MYGAIIGDLAGGIYEYEQLNSVHGVKTDKIIESNAFYSDDTILTIAIFYTFFKNPAPYNRYHRKNL